MAISTKKRPEARTEPPQEDIFQALGIENPDAKGQKAAKAASDASDVTVETLRRQIADLNETVRRQNDAQMALLAAPAVVRDDTRDTNAPLIDLKGLPDPLTDADGYNAALSERISGAIANGIALNANAGAAHANAASRADQLFEDFTEKFDAYSEFPDRVQFAAEKVAARAQARGLDVQKYMFATPDRFFADVVREYDGTFGKPEDEGDTGVDETDEGADVVGQRQPLEADESDDGRSASIFGGQNPTGGKKTATQQPSDMIKDMQDLQRASGFY